jgi:RNA polymerase sigma factor (TIGR02999 family)
MLDAFNGGDEGAFARLVDAVYADLRQIAGRRMADRFDRPLAALTLAPTAIANDAVMELRRQRERWQNSDQFFAIATRLIERLISGYQKQRNAQKRGGGARGDGNALDRIDIAAHPAPDTSCLEVAEALGRMHEAYPRQAEVVTLHVLCGHPLSKVSQMLEINHRTAERDWAFAKSWLARELKDVVL